MCTLALLRDLDPEHPLILVANRDERLDRPSEAPRRRTDPRPHTAGRDRVAGGTWLGVNEAGLVVGLTNHWTGTPADPRRASRGPIVTALMRESTVEEVARHLARLDPQRTNAFLLLAARAGEGAAWFASADGLRAHPIDEPAFFLGNAWPGSASDHRPRRLRELVESADGSGDLGSRLARALADHEGGPGAVCVHTDQGYGTVSSTQIWIGVSGRAVRLLHAEGAPCSVPFSDLSAELPRPS